MLKTPQAKTLLFGTNGLTWAIYKTGMPKTPWVRILILGTNRFEETSVG